MKLKNWIAASLLLLAITASVPCFAQITESDLSIAGVYFGQNFSEVKAVYGNPVKSRKVIGSGVMEYSFASNGTRFDVTTDSKSITVRGVVVSGNNGLATKAGIKVGMSMNRVIELYGQPDSTHEYKREDGSPGISIVYKIPPAGLSGKLLGFTFDSAKTVTSIGFRQFFND